MTELKILRYLIENNLKAFTIREISLNLDISYKIVYEIVQRLKNENLLTINKIGNSSQVKFNYEFNYKVLQVEIMRREDIFKNKNIKIIFNLLKEINSPLFIALLFGSYAKKTNTANSDIDLCVIYDNEQTVKIIESKLSLLPLEIDLNKFSVEEFKSMLKTKEFNVGSQIIENNIILHNIENYYDLIKNG